MMGLPYGEEIMIVGRTMWTQSASVTDRQTDRRTELLSQRPCNAERRTVKITVRLDWLLLIMRHRLLFCVHFVTQHFRFKSLSEPRRVLIMDIQLL